MIPITADEKLKPVDVVTIGFGWAGAIMAEGLTASGLTVLGLERGRARYTVPDFAAPLIHDELRFDARKAMMQDNTTEPVTQRWGLDDTALPVRRWNAFLPGTGLGGAGVHWNGQTWRYNEMEFELRSKTEQHYGKNFIDPELSIADWGLTYAELEPFYARFEGLCGISGKAGNIRGKVLPGGNPFEAPRSAEYPTPPLQQAYQGALFEKAASGLGYHPFPMPSANLSQPYVNPLGIKMNACMYCGFCERFACEHFAKASVQTTILPVLQKRPNFELRTGMQVLRINLDSTGKKATGVMYADTSGRVFEQPASLIICSAFSFNNPRMLLLSGIGTPYDPRTRTGVVGRNYAYQTMSRVNVFWDEGVVINPFMASGSIGTVISDFSIGAYDNGPLGFIGGSYIFAGTTGGRPIGYHPIPEGTPKWGRSWKEAVIRHYNHTGSITVNGSSMSSWNNYLDLDPTYKDAWGLPVLRMTFDFPENDMRMSRYNLEKAVEIGRAMGGKSVDSAAYKRPFDVTKYQSTHNTGGAIMGPDPRASVVNKYMQCWDVPNVFVPGASAFPQNSTYNPTGTLAALTMLSLDKIRSEYLKSPGPLVHA